MYSYFKARGCASCPRPAAHKDKQGSPKEGTFSKQTPLHFKSCFQIEKNWDKRVACVYNKRSAQLLRQNLVPARSCHCRGSLERTPGKDTEGTSSHMHTHTQILSRNCAHTLTLTFTHTCESTPSHPCAHTQIHTHNCTHSHSHIHTHALIHTRTHINIHTKSGIHILTLPHVHTI